jgi:hypothetical protein
MYPIFHPIAPYFLLSKIAAWKYPKANKSFLYSLGLEQLSKSASEISPYVLFKLAFKPLGGSFVSLIPFYRTGTGNAELGSEVNQRRYSG